MVMKMWQHDPSGACKGTRPRGANKIPAPALGAQLLLTAPDAAQAHSPTLSARFNCTTT